MDLFITVNFCCASWKVDFVYFCFILFKSAALNLEAFTPTPKKKKSITEGSEIKMLGGGVGKTPYANRML